MKASTHHDIRGFYFTGAGNRFILLDGILGTLPEDPADYARRRCTLDPFHPDGILQLDRLPDGCLRMAVYNRDGSRPQTCGNGLRCFGWHAVFVGHQPPGEFPVVTDAGSTPVIVEGADGGGWTARVAVGPVQVRGEHEFDGTGRLAVEVDCGNPHLVLLDSSLDDDEIGGLGPQLAKDPRFPEGTNVEFLQAMGGNSLRARVWERGVGETEACGTGACACAAVAVDRGLAGWPVRVCLPGGDLELTPAEGGRLWLSGDVALEGEFGSAPA